MKLPPRSATSLRRIETYLTRLYRYAFSLAREEELAKELVQQCALKSLAAKAAPKDEAAYRAWLFAIMRNTFLDHLRHGKLTDALFETESEHEDVPAMEYWRGDERLINILNVKQALARLRPNDQEIIGLIDMAGLSYAEASEVLGVPTGTIMSRISRARYRLLALVETSNVEPLVPRRGRRGK